MDDRLMFSTDTQKLLQDLIRADCCEIAAVACFRQSPVASPERRGHVENWEDDVFFVSADTDEDAYWRFINRNWKDYRELKATLNMRPPWRVFAEILGACSDVGGWYIWCETLADMALIGFKEKPGRFLEKRLRSKYRIERLTDALSRKTFLEDTPEFRDVLRAAYA